MPHHEGHFRINVIQDIVVQQWESFHPTAKKTIGFNDKKSTPLL
jgi:hypothetical protein